MIIRVYGEIIMIQLPQINWQIASFLTLYYNDSWKGFQS